MWDNHTLGQDFKKLESTHPQLKKTWIYTSPFFFLTNWILRLTKRTPPPQKKKSYLKLFLSLVWPQLISCGPAYLMIMIGANLNIYLWCYHTNFRLYPFWRRFFKDFFYFSNQKWTPFLWLNPFLRDYALSKIISFYLRMFSQLILIFWWNGFNLI